MTLLSKKRSAGPYRAYDEDNGEEKSLHVIADLSEEQKEAITKVYRAMLTATAFIFAIHSSMQEQPTIPMGILSAIRV